MRAAGSLDGDDLSCSVQTGLALVEAGLHPATGGDGTLACAGDMLLQALVGCAGVTLRAVATPLGVTVAGSIRAEGDLDVRGTLGVSHDARVAFREIRLAFDLTSDAPREDLEAVIAITERACVVYQTLAHPAELSVTLEPRQRRLAAVPHGASRRQMFELSRVPGGACVAERRSHMTDEERRRMLAAHWERHANNVDFEAAHAIYHDDAVLEWPQSGERFVGKETLRSMREGAPPLRFTTWRITGSGDIWTAENLMTVAGGEPKLTINVLEFRGDKVVREIVYITDRFDAAPERDPFAERFDVP